jgi:hypothetical protein
MYLWWKSYGILNNFFIENSFTSQKNKNKIWACSWYAGKVLNE